MSSRQHVTTDRRTDLGRRVLSIAFGWASVRECHLSGRYERMERAAALLEETLVALAAIGSLLAVVLLATRAAVQALAPAIVSCFALLSDVRRNVT